jgi:DNA-binding beta-propeller fold protein YncE
MLCSRRIFSALLLMGVACLVPVQAQSGWAVSKILPIGGEGGWDYVTVDAQTHRLFVTRTTHTIVIDTDSGKTLGDIPGQKSSHGVAVVPAFNRGFITDGGSGTIVVFDLKTYLVLGRLTALPDADGIIYDAGTNRVLAVTGDSKALLTFRPDIDPTTGKIDAPIELDGAPEFLAADGHGKAFINLQDKNTVAVVDLNSRKVVNRWPVAPGGKPVGMSMDAKTHRLFIGCRNPQMLLVMNAENGAIEASIPIGVGVDATGYVDNQTFASCRDGSFTVAGRKEGKFELNQVVKTPDGARTLAIDSESHRIYLPTADFEPATTGRPRPKPGTFKIVVIEKQ